MNANEPPINREVVVAELDAQIRHAIGILKARRGNVRRSLIGWKGALEDARKSVVEGTTTEAQVRALVHRGCRLAGAVPAERVGHDGETEIWITTGEAVSRTSPSSNDWAACCGRRSTVRIRHRRDDPTGGRSDSQALRPGRLTIDYAARRESMPGSLVALRSASTRCWPIWRGASASSWATTQPRQHLHRTALWLPSGISARWRLPVANRNSRGVSRRARQGVGGGEVTPLPVQWTGGDAAG